MDYPVEYGVDDPEGETAEAEYENVTDNMVSVNEEEVLSWRDAKAEGVYPWIIREVHDRTNCWALINSENVTADFLSGSPSGETSALILGYLCCVIRKRFRSNLQEADMENAASEAFFSAYRDRKNFRRAAKLTTWLYTIAFYAANHLHNNQKNNEFSSLDVLKKVSDREPVSPENPFSDVDTSDAFAAASKACLTANELRAFHLCREMGYSHEEAAKLEGVTANAMASRLSGGLKKLRAYFRDVYEWDIPEPADGRTHRGKKSAQIKSDKKLEIENAPGIDKIEENRE